MQLKKATKNSIYLLQLYMIFIRIERKLMHNFSLTNLKKSKSTVFQFLTLLVLCKTATIALVKRPLLLTIWLNAQHSAKIMSYHSQVDHNSFTWAMIEKEKID